MLKNLVAVIAFAVLSTLCTANAYAMTNMISGDTLQIHGIAWTGGTLSDRQMTPNMTRIKLNATGEKYAWLAEYDMKDGLKRAWGGYKPTPNSLLSLGRILISSPADLPAPHNALFNADSIMAVIPGLFDFGGRVDMALMHGRLNVTASVINGEGLAKTIKRTPAFDSDVNFTWGPLYGSFFNQLSNELRYMGGVASVKHSGVTLRGHLLQSKNLVTHQFKRVEMGDLEVALPFTMTFGASFSPKGYGELALAHTFWGKNAAAFYMTRDELGHWTPKVCVQGAVEF